LLDTIGNCPSNGLNKMLASTLSIDTIAFFDAIFISKAYHNNIFTKVHISVSKYILFLEK